MRGDEDDAGPKADPKDNDAKDKGSDDSASTGKEAEPVVLPAVVLETKVGLNHAMTATLGKQADVVFYTGGAVTLYGFELGVDKLVIDTTEVDTTQFTAAWRNGGQLFIDFGDGMTVTMVGLHVDGMAF